MNDMAETCAEGFGNGNSWCLWKQVRAGGNVLMSPESPEVASIQVWGKERI